VVSPKDKGSGVTIHISDIQGHTVGRMQKSKRSDSFIFPVGDLPSGSYNVSLETEGVKRITRKMVIVK